MIVPSVKLSLSLAMMLLGLISCEANSKNKNSPHIYKKAILSMEVHCENEAIQHFSATGTMDLLRSEGEQVNDTAIIGAFIDATNRLSPSSRHSTTMSDVRTLVFCKYGTGIAILVQISHFHVLIGTQLYDRSSEFDEALGEILPYPCTLQFIYDSTKKLLEDYENRKENRPQRKEN